MPLGPAVSSFRQHCCIPAQACLALALRSVKLTPQRVQLALNFKLLTCLRVCVQGSDARAAMLARLGAIEASAGACLLLVDNAEDTLCGPEPDALPTLLDKVGPGWGLRNAMSCLLPH